MQSLIEAFATASGTTALLDPAARELIVASGDRNPRRLKRFVNTFVLEHGLSQVAHRLDVDVEIKTLVLRTYFRDFALLFRERSNPVDEFLAYLRVRDAFLGGARGNDTRVREFLTSLGVAAGDHVSLTDVEERLPDNFPRLALSEPFVALVSGLPTESIVDEVRSKVEHDIQTELRRPSPLQEPSDRSIQPESDVASRREPPVAPSGPSLDGLELLWISKSHVELGPIAEEIRKGGGEVQFVLDADAALAVLSERRSDGLVWSAANVGGDGDGVFPQLEMVRGRFKVPVIFYGAWDDSRKAYAGKFGAAVAENPRELLFQVGRLPSASRR